MTTDSADAVKAVEEAGRAARGTVADLAGVPDERLDQALRAIADGLVRNSAPVLAANEADMTAAREAGLGGGLLDRLRLDEARLEAIAAQLRALAGVPYEPAERVVRELPGGLVLTERRRPVGVIGANFEARPNVVVDIASQFVKSRNAGVLRTGSAAIRSALTLADEVIAPAGGPRAAAVIANEQTSGLAASIVTRDQAAAAEFLAAYAGTGAFWNATTRLLDGFKLLSVPETGINIDAVPGPRGPVTFRDLYLRQFVVTPA